MHAARPAAIHDVMIAAADLENAEFTRDALALVCGDAIRQALATGLTYHMLAEAAGLSEVDVRRLAEQPTLPVAPPAGVAYLAGYPLPDLAAAGSPSLLPEEPLADATASVPPAPRDQRKEPDAAR
ncbi:hypothetical protein [Arthrobacter sp. N1]|uniref:hypothetical protein n=1 Tax=Arthrobacter sp. N1 TaxID=619291 RepID=UPI003BAFFD7D